MSKADAPITTPATTILDLAGLISTRQTVPSGLDRTLVAKAAALVLSKAGPALSPMSRNPGKILETLEKVEAYSGLTAGIRPIWLALRAFGLPSGAQIAVSGKDLEDPILTTLIEAGGLIPTTDETEAVRGVWGQLETRSLDTLVAQARVVHLDPIDQIHVGNGTGTLFVADARDIDAALQAIESKAPTRQSSSAKIVPLSYNRLESAQPAEFSATVFSSYRVRRIELPDAKPHPTDLVESAALASVLPPLPSYQPHFHPSIISQGLLSDVQLETVIYAGEAHRKYLPSHPDDDRKLPPRQGFLIGHGTGVGKGRIIAGIIADNWAQGRRRHLWFTERSMLIEDARQDWVTLGGKPEDVIDIREYPADKPLPPFTGILFATYAALRAENGHNTRLKQITDWFGPGEDGVVAFDEAQNLRNAKGDQKINSEISQQGQAAIDLQNILPNARVLYASATTAGDIVSLGFATRLGLWGSGTAFRNSTRFFKAMEEGGTNALEMVARDLKAMGLYLAANLSFKGLKYERLQRRLTSDERATQDRLAQLWLEIYDGLKRAMLTTGASRVPKKTRGLFHAWGRIQFNMARGRFFQALLSSLNTPHMIEAIREDLAAGHASVIQLTNTFEANADKAIEEAEENGVDMACVEASARDILLSYLRSHFPTTRVQVIGRGKYFWSAPMLDADGNPVTCPTAIAIRDQLIEEVEKISIPEGPLEQILDAFGPDQVAEVTGRQRRLVPGSQGKRILEARHPDRDNLAEIRDFMDDRKRILVFSSAGGSGATYSAQRTVRNQRLRRHYVLQAGWRADIALQGMGRTNRSDQVHLPEYILLTTDLWANQRMVSAVAKGMRDLGALTRGLRQAASQDFFTADDNLEDEFGETAWLNFLHKLKDGQIPLMSLAQFEREAGIELTLSDGRLRKPIPPVRRFLNAMSAMTCDNQALFGQSYRAELQALRLEAVETGSLDRGVETIEPDSLIKLEDAVIYRDPRTGGETRLLKMLRIDTLDPVSYHEARQRAMGRGATRVVKSLVTGRIAILSFAHSLKSAPSADDRVEVITPTGTRIRTRAEVIQEHWTQVDAMIAEQIWNAEMHERGDEEEREFWIISGAMLPIWDKLPRNRPTVFRMETDEGEQIIGRLVTEDFVHTLLKRVDTLNTGGLPQEDVDAALIKGGIVTLVNGWVLQGRIHSTTGKLSLLLEMPLDEEMTYRQLIQAAGAVRSIGPMTNQAYFRLPTDTAGRGKSLGRILAEVPAMGAAAL